MRAGSSDLRRAGVVDLVALGLALDERQAMLPSERRARDRELAPQLEGGEGAPRLRRWLALAASPALELRIGRVARAFAGLRAGFSVVGFVLGWSAASALLAIHGAEGRISLAACLAVLVGVPFFGWLASVALGLASLIGPRAAGAGEGARLSPLLYRLVLRLLPAAVRLDSEAVLGRARAHAALYARVQRAQLMSWLTQAGLFFGAGALAATLVFVVFTDLAFGWSTTLDVAPERVHRFVAAVSTPWARLWPEAAPSLELVAATRHFRVTGSGSAGAAAAGGVPPLVYGGWWPFLVMAIGCYAVLPRLVSLPLIGVWLGRECDRAMRLTPGVLELFESLATPQVESRAEGEEGPVGRALAGMVPEIDLRAWLARSDPAGARAPFAVAWAEAVEESVLRSALGVELRFGQAGGRRTLGEDEGLVRAVAEWGAEGRAKAGATLVLVRGHEPPVLDLLDFLAALRRAAGAERAICTVLAGGSPRDLATWRHRLVSLADPMLSVARLELPHG